MFAGLIALVVIFSSATGVADEGCAGVQLIHGVSVACASPRSEACAQAQADWVDSQECTNGDWCPAGCTASSTGNGSSHYTAGVFPDTYQAQHPFMTCGCDGTPEY